MKGFKNILYVCDDLVPQGTAFERAVALAENNQATLTVVGVVPTVTMGIDTASHKATPVQLQEALVKARREELTTLIEPFRTRAELHVDILVGKPFLEVIRAVLLNRYDLVIKVPENPSFVERLFGSDDMHLLRKCPCPLWFMKPEGKPAYERILAAVDFDLESKADSSEDLNQQILEASSSLALSDLAELHIVHAWDAPGEITVRTWSDNPDEDSKRYVEGKRARHERALADLRNQLKGKLGEEAYHYISPQLHMPRGSASKAIPETAKQLQADLIVMGTVARTGIAGLLIGNTAEAILEQLQCSVLAVKPSGFVSPVTLSD
ncbi:universal stress protein [Marinimicrobium sp. ABcell2]|uniref:universal stress protein n=1 Tax=Marinimicrobium sp. ABcell2 TaxID=3069751 RepID=UPI0027B03FE4|nr:universal stress protein [Marinimicrobium sp. ABcell2]MDQ2077653.1 universal stress protein [Marinimicrobium sp. ABcell2]